MTGADKMSVTILVPMLPPPANKYARMHWGERARQLDEWKTTIWHLMGQRERNFLTASLNRKCRMRVEITFQHKREYDQDNMHAVCKIPLDALVRLGFLVDDEPQFCELHVSQELLNAKQTRIFITEAA